MIKVIYKHWTKDKRLEVEGTMPVEYNNSASDRLVVKKPDGTFEDVLKDTVIRVEEV